MSINIVDHWFNQLKIINDPTIDRLVNLIGSPVTRLPAWNSIDDAVISIIISQMLSSKAASSIINRLYSFFLTSDSILRWSIENYNSKKSIHGVSTKKIKTIANWAISCERKNYNLKEYNNSEDVKTTFKNIHGLGTWSCDMLSVFFFCFPNVIPTSDLNVNKMVNRYFEGRFPSHVNGLETMLCICFWEIIDRKLELIG